MQYFEVPRPSGDGLCSDNQCPCPEVSIPRGSGYLYVSSEVVDFRRNALSLAAATRKVERLKESMGGMVFFGPGAIAAILMCRQGAKLRGIDLETAAADAKHWWRTGEAPLRATPKAGARKKAHEKKAKPEYTGPSDSRVFRARTVKDAKAAATAELTKEKILSFETVQTATRKTVQATAPTKKEAIEAARARVPDDAIEVGEPQIVREPGSGQRRVGAAREAEAVLEAQRKAEAGEKTGTEAHCVQPAVKGFLGLWIKEPAIWSVAWEVPCAAKIPYRLEAAVLARFKVEEAEAAPAAPPAAETSPLDALLIVFNREFSPKQPYVDNILKTMEVHGGHYEDFVRDDTPVRILTNPKAQDAMAYMAMAFVNFRELLHERFDSEHVEVATFEGTQDTSGVVLSHWSN